MSTLPRVTPLLVGAALLAGCGGSATGGGAHAQMQTPTSTSTSTSTSTTAGAQSTAKGPALPKVVAFANCMRAHGVPDFPDQPIKPTAPNGTQPAQAGSGGINPTAPAYQTASKDCAALAPASKLSQSQSDQVTEAQLKFAVCMRANGVPDYPDPSSNGTGANNAGVDLAAPAVQRAEKACSSLIAHILPSPPGGG